MNDTKKNRVVKGLCSAFNITTVMQRNQSAHIPCIIPNFQVGIEHLVFIDRRSEKPLNYYLVRLDNFPAGEFCGHYSDSSKKLETTSTLQRTDTNILSSTLDMKTTSTEALKLRLQRP